MPSISLNVWQIQRAVRVLYAEMERYACKVVVSVMRQSHTVTTTTTTTST